MKLEWKFYKFAIDTNTSIGIIEGHQYNTSEQKCKEDVQRGWADLFPNCVVLFCNEDRSFDPSKGGASKAFLAAQEGK